MAAIGAGQRSEIGVGQIGAADPPGVGALLMHADGAVAAVVGHDHHHLRPVLHGGGHLVEGHLETAVARQAHHGAFGVFEAGGDCRRKAVPHGARRRRKLGAMPLEAEIAVQEGGIVARPVGKHRILGQVVGQPAHHILQLHRAGGFLRLLPGLVVGPRGAGPTGPGRGRTGRAVLAAQGGQEIGRGGGDGQICAVDAARHRRVGMDMDDRLARAGRVHEAVAAGGNVAKARPEDQQTVGLAQAVGQFRVHSHAKVAHVTGLAVVHVILPAEAHRHRQAEGAGKALEVLRRPGRPHRPARHHQRAGGPGQQGQRLGQLRFGYRRGRQRRWRQHGGRGRAAQHILRQGQNHRPRPSRHGHPEGAVHIFGQAVGVIHLGHPFGQPAEEGAVVHLLKGVAVAMGTWDLAHEQHHRGGIVARHVNPGTGIGGTGAAGDEGHAGPAGQLARRLGHHRRTTFVAAYDILDARAVQPVEHRQKALSGNREHPRDPMRLQLLHKQLPAVPPAAHLQPLQSRVLLPPAWH